MNTKINFTKKLIKDLWIALRPLSLTLAIASTTLGILMAHREVKLFSGNLSMDILKMVLVTLGGILAQSGTNLVNDFFEGSFKYHRPNEKTYKFLKYERTKFDLLVFGCSIACFGLTALIGIYLMYITNFELIYIGIAGIIGGYAYTGEPIVYKKRGLGTPLSFILMGPLMVLGAYFVFTESYSIMAVILTLPACFMIPLLMLSNELRDFKRDGSLDVKTLVVRYGASFGRGLFITLMVSSYALTALFVFMKLMPLSALLVFITIPIALNSYKNVSKAKGRGIPITNSLHIAFNLITILALAFG